jgi:general stress protein 26
MDEERYMKDQSSKGVSQNFVQRAWEIAASIPISILVTRHGSVQRARPMAAHANADDHAIYFLTDADSDVVSQIDASSGCTVVFSNQGSNDYASFVGRASVSEDRKKIAELWSVFAKTWWDSPQDPSIRLITFSPTEAEIWDGPNKLIAGAILLAAAITGNSTPVGDHAKVKV